MSAIMREFPEQEVALQQRANRIRALTLEQVLVQGGGYLGQACSSAEILSVLFGHAMQLGPGLGPVVPEPFRGAPGSSDPSPNGGRYLGARKSQLDRFVLSPSHYAMALYAALITDGRLDPIALRQFNVDGSSLEMIGAEHSPGCELTTGSFGQALSQAAGIAWARRRSGDTGVIWVLLSDGEVQEGQTWEAIQFLAFHRLDNIRIIVDVNGQQVDGRMVDVMGVEPLEDRFRAFGATTVRINGHDIAALQSALATLSTGAPLVVLADTQPTTGLEVLADRTPRLHYIRVLGSQDEQALRAELHRLTAETRIA